MYSISSLRDFENLPKGRRILDTCVVPIAIDHCRAIVTCSLRENQAYEIGSRGEMPRSAL